MREKERRRRHQGRVVLAPRHVTPVVNRLFGYSTKATTGDEASSTAIKARLVASAHRSLRRSLDISRARAASSFWRSARSTCGEVSMFLFASRGRESRSMRDYVEEIVSYRAE